MIFVGSVTSFLLNLRLKHPARGTVSIDYNIAIVLVPMMLFGTMVGVTLNQVIPALIILILLTIFLLVNTYKVLKR
jgi:uncharacterized membrane protein YfcA